MLSLAIVQYVFTLGEHKVHVASHGNCRSKEPFIGTMPSVMEKLKCQSDHKTPYTQVSIGTSSGASCGPHLAMVQVGN